MAKPYDPAASPALTPTQLLVLRGVCEGKLSKEIAADLHIGKRTVDYHIRGIYQKLDTHTRVQALHRAQQLGLIP